MDATQIDQILEKLMKSVEASVHAFYRGDVRQHTQRVKTDTFLREARQALMQLEQQAGVAATPASGGNAVGTAAPAPAAAPLSPEEIAAATRCVMGWMPMGPPTSAAPDSRCVAAAREMTPTWGERERARTALKRIG